MVDDKDEHTRHSDEDDLESLLKEKVQLLSVLMRSGAVERGDVETAVREMTEVAADVLEVARVGFWRFTPEGDALELVDLFSRTALQHESGTRLPNELAPRYFDAIRSERIIPADDARTDERTSEFADNYLVQHSIGAMLDAPVMVRGELVGVVCHEHVGGPRMWRAWEELAAGTFADCIALALTTAEARAQRHALQKARDDLETLVMMRTEALKKSEESFRQLFQAAPVALVLSRASDASVIEGNARASALFEVPLDEVRGQRTPDFWAKPEDRKRALNALATLGRAELEAEFKTASGRTFVGDMTSVRVEHNGEPALLVGLRDITAMKEAEAALKNRRRTLETLLEAAPVPLVLTRMADATLLFCNDRAGDLFGATPFELIGRRAPDFYVNPEDRAAFIQRVKRDGRVSGFAARLRSMRDRKFWAVLDAQRFDLEGDDVIMVGFSDVSEQKAIEEDLRTLASTDALTGALNRRRFFEVADSEVARADRYNHPLSVAMIDVDHFKLVNDTFGHKGGDDALRHIAMIVKETLRTTDVLGRYGGEELAVLLPETPLEPAHDVLDRLRARIASTPALSDGRSIGLAVSIGVACKQPGETLSSVLARADAALYVAKNEGRDRVASDPREG
jgi:diguanylate cyclase (GGDEF)-like protein/PAS domain S-box-containing protein